MKYIRCSLLILIAILVTVSVSAQQQQKSISVSQTLIKLSTSSDTLQYTLGAFVGQWMVRNGFTIGNPTLFKRGMDDVLQNKPLSVTDSTIVKRVAAYQLSTQNERNRLMEEQLFASLKGKPGVGALPDGVQYIVMKTGTGKRPNVADTVVINAIGIFPDGTLFEDTFQKKQAITTVTGTLIPGLNEAIQLMPEGSVWRIFIPSSLAYGPAGLQNVIPPNTALIFEITLIEVKQVK